MVDAVEHGALVTHTRHTRKAHLVDHEAGEGVEESAKLANGARQAVHLLVAFAQQTPFLSQRLHLHVA